MKTALLLTKGRGGKRLLAEDASELGSAKVLIWRVESREIAGSGMVGEFEREELPHSFPSRRCTSEENPNLKRG